MRSDGMKRKNRIISMIVVLTLVISMISSMGVLYRQAEEEVEAAIVNSDGK